MSLRRRFIRIASGIRLNLGLHGAGLSVGPRGLHVGVNHRGMYTSASIPGKGICSVHHVRSSSGEHASVAGEWRRLRGHLDCGRCNRNSRAPANPLEMM
jgi:hypothetical protein